MQRNMKNAVLASAAVLMTGAAAHAAPATYQAAVTAQNPYVYYRLGETSGTTATDSSLNGRNGTYVGDPTLGVAGYGLASDTAVSLSNDHVSTPMSSFGTSVPNSSYEFIFKADSSFTSVASLFGLINADPDGTGPRTGNQAIGIELNAANVGATNVPGTSRIWLRDEGSAASSGGSSSQLWANIDHGALLDGEYHHFAITVDLSAATAMDKVKAYLDGLPLTITDAAESTALADDWHSFTVDGALGARNIRNTSLDRYAPITVDEMALYAGTLSPEQIAANATAAGFVVPEPGSLTLAGIAGLGLLSRRRRQA